MLMQIHDTKSPAPGLSQKARDARLSLRGTTLIHTRPSDILSTLYPAFNPGSCMHSFPITADPRRCLLSYPSFSTLLQGQFTSLPKLPRTIRQLSDFSGMLLFLFPAFCKNYLLIYHKNPVLSISLLRKGNINANEGFSSRAIRPQPAPVPTWPIAPNTAS